MPPVLGSVYLVQRQFASAAQESQKAIQFGKTSANGAQLVLGEALAALGQREQAQQALTCFVTASPESPAAPTARQLINTLETSPFIENKDVSKEVRLEAAQISAKSVPLVANLQRDMAVPAWPPPLTDDPAPFSEPHLY